MKLNARPLILGQLVLSNKTLGVPNSDTNLVVWDYSAVQLITSLLTLKFSNIGPWQYQGSRLGTFGGKGMGSDLQTALM